MLNDDDDNLGKTLHQEDLEIDVMTDTLKEITDERGCTFKSWVINTISNKYNK